MNDPQNFIWRPIWLPTWLPLSAATFLVAVLMCLTAHGQSFYQQGQSAVAKNGNSAWQPPQSSRVKPQSLIRQATNLAPLKPPHDIFTQNKQSIAKPLIARPPTAQPEAAVASTAWNQFTPPRTATAAPLKPERVPTAGQFEGARRLGNSSNYPTTGKGLFDSINMIAESDQSEFGRPEFASANLEIETTTSRTDFDALTSGATAKLGDVKEWVGEKTGAMLGGLKDGSWQERLSRMFGGADIRKIIGGLAVVIGGYLGLVWLLRMINPAGSGAIPREVLEVVGAAPLNSKQNLQLIRLGSKLMLMIHGPEGTQPIGEVSDPAEVEQLLALCGGRGQRVSPAVGAAIENRMRSGVQSNSPAIDIASHQNGSINLSPGDSNNLNQLLRALEKYQGHTRQFEA